MSTDAAASATGRAPFHINPDLTVTYQGWNIPFPPAPSGPGKFVASPVEGVTSVVTKWATFPAAACTRRHQGIAPGTPEIMQREILAMGGPLDLPFAMGMLGGAFREAKTAGLGQPVPAANDLTLVASQTYTVRFRWESVLQQVAQAGGMQREVSYQSGVSKTDSVTTAFSISIGIEDSGEFLGIGGKLTETFSYSQSETHEVSVSSVTTEMQHYDIPPNSSIQAWQLIQVFETGPLKYDMGKYGIQMSHDGTVTIRPGATLTIKTPTIISLSFTH